MKPFIPYGRQWLDKNDINAVLKVLQSDWLTQGPAVQAFEQSMTDYTGIPYAVAVSSGTAALHLAYLAAGLRAGDEVITTPLTFAATSTMLLAVGARPVFVDINPDTLTIDPKNIEKKITKKTKALAVVDFAGHPCDYDAIAKIAKKHNLLVIEDAAHALGSRYKGKHIGAKADMTILSFHPVKTITTGEGGMLLANRREFYDHAKQLRAHGMVKYPEKGGWYYKIEELGFNYRLTDIQSALGISQLRKLAKFIARRKAIVHHYTEAFASLPVVIPPKEASYADTAWHLYPLQFAVDTLRTSRKVIFEKLHAAGIGAQVHYMPLHLQPLYTQLGYKKGDFPHAEAYYERAISLPLFPKMTAKEVRYVIATVRSIINDYHA